ncbi:MAG: YbhB/YbcL family Raf kinase inhibitor-like protein [Anaerolineae bacterium]|nr:YbhB/YbcL family Raf kinase inhibitor-like protein [Anaerolineae bacterium]
MLIREHKLLFLPVVILFFTTGCGGEKSSAPKSSLPTFDLHSPAFTPGHSIPRKYTCQGDDVSPPLQWDTPPQGTQSLALIMDDPDAPGKTWVHWVLFDIPGSARSLPEAIPSTPELPDGSQHGRNSWGRLGYGGPCPPSGTHRYFFRLYALDTRLNLSPGVTEKQLRQAMQGHILAQAELMGTYHK